MDNSPDQPKSHILKFGPSTLELCQGDVLAADADAICCPVDDQCTATTGLFSVMKQQGVLAGDIMQGKKRLPLGVPVVISTHGIRARRAMLIPIYNQQYGVVDRVLVQKGLVQALKEADKLGMASVATPLLGYVKSHVDHGIICGVSIKAVREFSEGNPASVRRIAIYAFTHVIYQACQDQFFNFSQAL